MFELVLKTNFEVCECNFENLEQKLNELIQDKYDIVVTEDSVKEAKNVRAEINKGKKALEGAWKNKKAEMEAPIKELNEKFKNLLSVCDEAMKKIDMQVIKFEASKRELAVKVCTDYKNSICELKGLDPSTIYTDNLNNLSYVTEKGAISAQGRQAVDTLILQKLAEISAENERRAQEELALQKIKNEAKEEVLRDLAQAQMQVQTQADQAQDTQEAQEAQEAKISKVEAIPSDDTRSVFTIKAEFKIISKRVDDVEQKIKKWALSQIEKTDLKSAFSSIEVCEVLND